jgi:hypothetical protein
MPCVTITLTVTGPDGTFCQATHSFGGPNKSEVYMLLATTIRAFADKHGVHPDAVQQSSVWRD